jgi:hypothetical protein
VFKPNRVCAEIAPLGLLDTGEHYNTRAVNDPRITNDKFIPVPAEPGDIIFFSSFLVHRTSEADDGLVRVALIGSFNNARERTYVEHGYPTGYKYSNQNTLIYEGFPTLADVAAIFPGIAHQVMAERRVPEGVIVSGSAPADGNKGS